MLNKCSRLVHVYEWASLENDKLKQKILVICS